MIYPQTLYNFGKVCKSNERAGRVLRALCKQSVKLDESDLEWVEAIQNDNEWMDERVGEKREKEKNRKAEYRNKMSQMSQMSQGQNGTPKCPKDKTDETLVPHPSYLPPSPPSSLPSSPQTNTNRSVTVTVPASNPNGNGNGTVDLRMDGGIAEAKRRGHRFAAAANKDQGAFFDPEYDPITICATVTGDWKSLKRWRQLVIAKGDAAVREEVFTFWREISAGEDVDNRGATLNARLAALRDQPREGAEA